MKTVTRKLAAFTIIELLVVVAVLATLVGLLVPTLAKMRTQARVGATRTVLNTLDGGLGLYYADHKIYPFSNPPAGVSSGAANLVRAMTGYPEYGKGFQLVQRGPVYGPYAGTEKLRVDASKLFIDAWDHPILYYAFDSNCSRGSPAKYYDDNNNLSARPGDINHYAIDAGGNYFNTRYLLLSPGPDGEYSAQGIGGGRNDDITNLRSE